MNKKNQKRGNQHQRINSNSADSKSKSRGSISLSKNSQNISLFEIERIQRLIQLQKISLSGEVLQRLAQKRKLQLIKQRNILERKRQRSLFIDFDFNPLAIQQNHNHSLTDRTNRPKINLINAVAELKNRKDKNRGAIEKLRQRTEVRIDAVLKYKYHLQKNANFAVGNNKDAQFQLKKQTASKDSLILRKAFQDLDNILEINQKKVNIQKNENLNIFSILFKQRTDVILEVRQLLVKYNFYFQSIAHSLIKQTKINPFIDISIFNRYFATNSLSKIPENHKITSIHIFIILSNLNVNDLLLIASGKLTPRTLFQHINENALQNSNEDDEQHQYLLKFNKFSNQFKNHLSKNQVNTSIHASDNLQIIQKMWRMDELMSFTFKVQLQKLVHEEKTVNNYKINHIKLKNGIKQRKQQLVLGIINKRSHVYKNMESKISALKGKKDCFERSRNNAAIQIFKRYRQSLNEMVQDRRKHKNIRHKRKSSSDVNKTLKRFKVSSEEKANKRKQSIRVSKSTAQYYD